jgi:hypothetical protein
MSRYASKREMQRVISDTITKAGIDTRRVYMARVWKDMDILGSHFLGWTCNPAIDPVEVARRHMRPVPPPVRITPPVKHPTINVSTLTNEQLVNLLRDVNAEWNRRNALTLVDALRAILPTGATTVRFATMQYDNGYFFNLYTVEVVKWQDDPVDFSIGTVDLSPAHYHAIGDALTELSDDADASTILTVDLVAGTVETDEGEYR